MPRFRDGHTMAGGPRTLQCTQLPRCHLLHPQQQAGHICQHPPGAKETETLQAISRCCKMMAELGPKPTCCGSEFGLHPVPQHMEICPTDPTDREPYPQGLPAGRTLLGRSQHLSSQARAPVHIAHTRRAPVPSRCRLRHCLEQASPLRGLPCFYCGFLLMHLSRQEEMPPSAWALP